MREGIHPQYDYVVFRDASADFQFLTRSTMTSEKTVVWEDGASYPVVDVQISSASHPFWTGKSRTYEEQSRVAKFMRKYGREPK
ncbi:type B 50S ribosomal protein L31 [Salininema proteolyticum]|uniref:Large ribosomal subunit protein bL31B n=1 Tax=Salininema proteolyticum TaxID=1607685 RepID=A0ABV8U0L0_9ACTN